MNVPLIIRVIKLILGVIFCSIAIILPHKARNIYVTILSFFAHLPYLVFGSIAFNILKKLKLKANEIDWE